MRVSSQAAETPLRRIVRAAVSDPRHFQLAVLSGLLIYGTFVLGFPTGWGSLLAAAVGLGIEATFGRLLGRRFDPRSPLITALSLSLLLRATSPWLYGFAAAIAIGGKLLLRVRGKHLFNPATLGIMVSVLFTGQAWLSPGQWGSSLNLAFLMACLGGVVVHRACAATPRSPSSLSTRRSSSVALRGWAIRWPFRFTCWTAAGSCCSRSS